jgi:hypothetical protein
MTHADYRAATLSLFITPAALTAGCSVLHRAGVTGATSCAPSPPPPPPPPPRSCAAGSYLTAAETCALCPVGQFQSLAGQSSCELCPPGSYQDRKGATACKVCQPRTYQNLAGHHYCKWCPYGPADVTGAESCMWCLHGTTGERPAQRDLPPACAGSPAGGLTAGPPARPLYTGPKGSKTCAMPQARFT